MIDIHKHCLLLTFLLSGMFCVSAQKEVYFNDTNIDRKDIKVDKTMQGVSLNTDFIPMFGSMERSFKVNVHYFHEDRIAPTLTLHSFAGLQNNIAQDRFIYNDMGGYGNSNNPMRTYYNLNLQLGTELRWYFGYRPRYIRSRKVTNNTGWFLGVPITFTAYLLHQPNDYIKQWLPESFNANLTFGAKAGYRYAFNKHWLLEASLTYIPAYLIMAPYGNYFYLSSEWMDMFRLELKAAYAF